MTTGAPHLAWFLPISLLVASLVVLAGWGFATRRRALPDASPMAGIIVFEVTPIGVARWAVDREGADTQIALSEGSVSVHVAKLSTSQRFVLALPDGQIEVRGTRFVANVDQGRTRDISVSEGTVALHIASSEERILRMGESWSAELGDVAADTTPSSAIVAEAPNPPKRPGDTLKPSSRQPLRDPQPREGSAGAAFSDAMTAFSSGAYETADALFAQFQKEFPTDARNEDADFLRIIIEKRLGNRDATTQRAKAYLERYPRGFRRNDVDRILR